MDDDIRAHSEDATEAIRVSIGPDCRLAVYGSLAPGQPNHRQLSSLSGRWIEGIVCGRLIDEGWGAELGYPGIVLDPDAGAVGVQVLESPDLPKHWTRLDEFEGSGYRRRTTVVSTGVGDVSAYIYVLALSK